MRLDDCAPSVAVAELYLLKWENTPFEDSCLFRLSIADGFGEVEPREHIWLRLLEQIKAFFGKALNFRGSADDSIHSLLITRLS